LKQVKEKPKNARLLYNARRYFSWVDEWQQSQELIERAYAIAPEDHDIAFELAELYWRDARRSSTPAQVSSLAAKSLKSI